MSTKETTKPTVVKGARPPKKESFYNQKYKVPEGEEDQIHAIIEKIEFDEDLKISKPSIYKTNARQWSTFLKNHEAVGFTILRILHAPKDAVKFDAKELYVIYNSKGELVGTNEKKLRQIEAILSGKYDEQ